MAIDAGTILRGAAKYTTPGGSEPQNVAHWVMTGESSVAESQVILDMKDAWSQVLNEVKTSTSADVSFDEIECWRYDVPSASWVNIGTQSSIWTGTGAVDVALAAATSAFMRADTVWPKAKGRKYLPVGTENQLTDQLWGSAFLVQLAAAAADWLTAYTSGARIYTPGVWSEKLTTFFSFSGTATVTNVPAYQRRRKPGVGS